MKKEIRIGIVGAGGMGRVHFANIQKVEGARVVALCDVEGRAESAAAEWGVTAFHSISDMLQGSSPDLVDICTPTFCHHDQVLESLKGGAAVLVEKPIALSLADAKEMLDTAETLGLPLFVAQVLQFTKEVEYLKQAVRDERYGKPIDAHFERLSACPKWAAGGWLFDKNKSGLLPYDLHIHDLDVIVSVFGEPESVRVHAAQSREGSYPEHIRAIYQYPGLQVVGEAAWLNGCIPFTARWRVAFEKGVLVNEGGKLLGYRQDGTIDEYDIRDEVTVSTGINVPPCGWYYNELKHFVNCLREGKPSDRVPPRQLLTVMGILEDMSRECQ